MAERSSQSHLAAKADLDQLRRDVAVAAQPTPAGEPPTRLAVVVAAGDVGRGLLQLAPSWLASGAVHTVLLIALGLMAVVAERGASTHGLLGTLAEGDRAADAAPIIEIEAVRREADAAGAASQSGQGSQRDSAAAGGLLSESDTTRLEIAPVETGGAVAGSVADQIATAVGNGRQLDRVITGPPPGGSGEVIGKGYASFFGVEAKGYKFVYIVDASGSMFGRRFAKAHTELISSLTALDEHQSFYVIFFNSTDYPQFYPLPEQNLAPVSPTNIQRVIDWIARSVIPQGETSPNSALSRALALAPDAIFLLSDGEFNEGAAYVVRQENYRRTPIHTIAFESEVGAFSLGQIARMTGGIYRFVP